MKNTKITLIALAAIAILSCTSPTKDFDVHISPTFYKYVIEVELYDITNPTAPFPVKPTIEITGADASAIYNIDGTKNFETNFGSLQLILARSSEPSAGDPIDFQVKFSSNSYQEITLPVSVGVDDYFLKYDLGMLDPSNLPTGITNSTKSGTVGTNGQLAQPVVITAGSNDSLSKVVLTVPNDITFQDANGNAVSGSQLDVNVLSLSDTSTVGQQVLPNGGGIVQQVIIDGVVSSQILPPSSTFKVDMSLGGNSVKKFTGDGITMKIDVPSIMFNEEANRAYQAGDSISLLSNSDGATNWEPDGTFLVKADGQGELYVDAKVKHLSWKRLFRRFRIPFTSTTVKANASLPGGTNNSVSGDIELLVSVPFFNGNLIIARPKLPRTISNNISQLYSKEFNWPGSTAPAYTVRVGNRGTIKNPLFDFAYSNPSPATTNIVATPSGSGVSVSFSLYCAGNNTVVNPPAGVKMYYKETGVPNIGFTHLYTFTQQNVAINTGRVYQLDDNKRYDFRALFGDAQIDTLNVLVEDGKHYQVILPQSTCNEIF